MALTLSQVQARLERYGRRNESFLYFFSCYGLPLLIGLGSVLAFLSWPDQFPQAKPSPASIKVIRQSSEIETPAQALEAVRSQAAVVSQDTRLSEDPFWMVLPPTEGSALGQLAVEFPSRHATALSCWNARSLAPLGQAERSGALHQIRPAKAGFALELDAPARAGGLVCKVSSVGPARLTAVLWDSAELQASVQEFHRRSGLLDGGILVLALFVLITALINRNSLYLLFAAWLVLNLRMAALSMGWDTQWLGQRLPGDWLIQARMVTIALFYAVTLALFTALFKDDLADLRHKPLLRFAQWTCLPLLLLSLTLPFAWFLPVMWCITGIGISTLVFLMVRVLQKTRSRAAGWYAAAISVTLLASFSEVIAAALGIKGMIGAVNSVTAALSSSLLTALAIAEQMREEHAQRLQVQAEMAQTFKAIPIGMFTLDIEGRFLSANPALMQMLGKQVLTEGSKHWHQYFEAGAWGLLHQQLLEQSNQAKDPANNTQDGGSVELEIKAKKHAGNTSAKRFLVKATLSGAKVEGSLQDVTDKSKATEELYFLANHDALTKVLNRRGVEKSLNAAMQQLSNGQAMALAYLDLDRFKLVNDLFGHNVGDEVLQQVCKRITDMLPKGIDLGRVGGDEFVIVFPDTSVTRATHMCRGVVENIGTRPYRVGGKAFYVRGSIGLIEVESGMRRKDVISTADRACRQAKLANSGGLVVYEKYALAFQQHEAELRMMSKLSTPAATDGLYLEMQPILSLSAPYDSLNFEVLLRMLDPQGNPVPTAQVISAGEASGRMSVIDRWVVSSTLAWLEEHQDKLQNTRFVCVNLSGASLNDEQFLDDVCGLLRQYLPIAKLVCLEITESVALQDVVNTRRFVDEVRRIGARVALDDFGAGYTSFSYLKDFTADVIKIDGSFIVDINRHPANIAIVEAIVSLAKNLGMKVIAEWAEDAATVQTLKEIGVDYVQGFVVARSQHPDMLLLASSSASFIKNTALDQLMRSGDHGAPNLAQVELFADQASSRLH